MDERKHPHTETAGQIDVSSVKHCLQKGDAKLALQYCHDLLARDAQHIQSLLFADIASRSLGRLDDAALCIDPKNIDAHWNRSHILLTPSKYEEGFKLYETRWHHPQVVLKKRKFES